jgi:cell wall-associated NlpC family hydrolase
VQRNDSLTGIAAKLKVRLRELLAANKLVVTSMIYPGMKLIVPAGGVVPAAPAAPAPTPTASPAQASPALYTVRNGDYLGGIASKMGVSLSSLLATNKLTPTSMIHPGSTLIVPAGRATPPTVASAGSSPSAGSALVYVVRSGDYLSGIAPALGVKIADLLSVNKLTLTSMIYPGMKLQVPPGGRLPVAAAPTAPAATPGGTAAASSGSNPTINKVLDFARAQLGEPYKFNSAGPDTWDCSGLTLAAYAEIGVSLPHYSGAQVGYGVAVDWRSEAIKPGDLIFLESSVGSGIINHVGLAISDTQWIHAPRTGDVVRIGNIPSTRVVAVRRLVQGG